MTPTKQKKLEKLQKQQNEILRQIQEEEDELNNAIEEKLDYMQSCKDCYQGFWHADIAPHLSAKKDRVFIKVNRSSLKVLIKNLLNVNLRYSTGDRMSYLGNDKLTVHNVINIQHKLIDFLYGEKVTYKEVEDACLSAALDNPYDRVQDYFVNLCPDNQETSHIETWLTQIFGAEDTPINRIIGKKWLVSGIARAMEPGCYVEGTLTLFGSQGSGKSAACMVLAPFPDTYFGDTIDIDNTQKATQTLQGKFLVEHSEMSSITPKAMESVKNWIIRKEDTYVEKYANIPNNVPRQFICVATTNAATPLNDNSGNRRFWVVKVGDKVDLNRLKAIKDELWFEARKLYEVWSNPAYRESVAPRDPWVLTKEEREMLDASNREFEVPSSIADWLMQNFYSFPHDDQGFVKYSDIKTAVTKLERISDSRLSNILTLELGCANRRLADGSYYKYSKDDFDKNVKLNQMFTSVGIQ